MTSKQRRLAKAGKPNSKQRRTLREAKERAARREGLVARLKEIL
jgi:hypothetical protein